LSFESFLGSLKHNHFRNFLSEELLDGSHEIYGVDDFSSSWKVASNVCRSISCLDSKRLMTIPNFILVLEFDHLTSVEGYSYELALSESHDNLNKLLAFLNSVNAYYLVVDHNKYKTSKSPHLLLFLDKSILSLDNNLVSLIRKFYIDKFITDLDLSFNFVTLDSGFVSTSKLMPVPGNPHFKPVHRGSIQELLLESNGLPFKVSDEVIKHVRVQSKSVEYSINSFSSQAPFIKDFSKVGNYIKLDVFYDLMKREYSRGNRFNTRFAFGGFCYYRGLSESVTKELFTEFLKKLIYIDKQPFGDGESFDVYLQKCLPQVCSAYHTPLGTHPSYSNWLSPETVIALQTKSIFDTQPNQIMDELSLTNIIYSPNQVNFKQVINLLDTYVNHTYLFDYIDAELGLKQPEFIPIKKFLHYFLISAVSPKYDFRVGSYFYDNRVFANVIAPAGGGKTTIKTNGIKTPLFSLIRDKRLTLTSFSGMVHPEQLKGKVIANKLRDTKEEKPYINALGYLGYDVLLHDEINDILNEVGDYAPENAKLIRESQDVYLHNEINKKNVDTPIGRELQYFPKCISFNFLHPTKLKPVFFEHGTYRRAMFFEVHIIDKDINDALGFLNPYSAKRDLSILLQDIHLGLTNLPRDFVILPEHQKIVADWITLFIFYIREKNNKNLTNLLDMHFQSLNVYFFRFIALLHNSYNLHSSDADLVNLACIDAIHFMLNTYSCFVKYGYEATNFVSDIWGDLPEPSIIALNYLYSKGYTSFSKSKVEIGKFQTMLGELHGYVDRSARRIYSKLKSDGYIDDKHEGHTTTVWLKFKPKYINFSTIDYVIKHLLNEPISISLNPDKQGATEFKSVEQVLLHVLERKYKACSETVSWKSILDIGDGRGFDEGV
jgi:hypothetical protein